jgi:hypothetical protein
MQRYSIVDGVTRPDAMADDKLSVRRTSFGVTIKVPRETPFQKTKAVHL